MSRRNGKLLALTIAALAVVLDPRAAGAQDFSLQIGNGLVTLVARDAPVPQILDRWAQIGGTTFVNRESTKGALVTLQLNEVPERTALAILLRDVGGYILAERLEPGQGTSAIDRVLLFPRTPTAAQPQPSSLVVPPDLTGRSVGALQADLSEEPRPVNVEGGLIVDPGEMNHGVGVPPGSPMPWIRPGEGGPAAETLAQSAASTPGGTGAQTKPGQFANPYGLGGSARPGEISTVPRRDESARPRPDPPESQPQQAAPESLAQPDQR